MRYKKMICKIVLGLALLVFMIGPMVVLAAPDASACYRIANPDYRMLCVAKVKKNRSYCYSVVNAELRARCMAEVENA